MEWPKIHYWIRYWTIIILSIGATGIFWGGLAGGIVRVLFKIEEETALLWIALPIFLACIPICIFILPKHLRRIGIL